MSLKSFLKKIPFLNKIFKDTYIKKKASDFEKLSENIQTDPKLIVFESFQGRSYSCSPKAIYEYMLSCKEFSDYKYVWVFRDVQAHGNFPNNTKLVKFDSEESFKAYSAAGTWIVNSRLRDFLVPREDQKYIQCWHGTPLKKIGCDITCAGNATSTVEEIHAEYTGDAEKIHKFISPSDYTTEKLISAFNLQSLNKENDIIQQGYPRNDALFKFTGETVSEIKEKLNIPENKKVILYCPTFRDNQHNSEGYTLEIGMDFGSIKEKFGDDVIILFRAHYFISSKFNFDAYENFVINVSDYDDINDLYIISDILITDYSSVFFDFANLCRPMIFYIYDSTEYKSNMRDFYFGTAMLPGFSASSQEKLEKAIFDILADFKKGGNGLMRYSTAIRAFNKKFNPLEDGHSAERTVKSLFFK